MTRYRTRVAAPVIPVVGLLGVAFVVLKLCGVIAWPWAWVLAPFWMPIAAACVLGILAMLIVILITSLTRKGR